MDASPQNKIDHLFAQADDFTLCDAVHCAIEDQHNYEKIIEGHADVPEDRRIIHYIWGITGFLETNGFSYFWGVDIDHDFYPVAFEAIGNTRQAANIRKSLELITDRSVLGDYQAVESFFGSENDVKTAAASFEDSLYDEKADIQERLSKFIRKHRYSYADLMNQIASSIESELE